MNNKILQSVAMSAEEELKALGTEEVSHTLIYKHYVVEVNVTKLIDDDPAREADSVYDALIEQIVDRDIICPEIPDTDSEISWRNGYKDCERYVLSLIEKQHKERKSDTENT